MNQTTEPKKHHTAKPEAARTKPYPLIWETLPVGVFNRLVRQYEHSGKETN